MKVTATEIPDVLLIEPRVFADERGFFFESFNEKVFRERTGVDVHFFQDNHSQSRRNVLRGLHYQVPPLAQGKLVRVVRGEVFDVAVDLRPDSPTRGRWVGRMLSEDNKAQLWIPPGFAHGFMVTSDLADVLYKATAPYSQEHERCIIWNDELLAIDWPGGAPILSKKDLQGVKLPKTDN